jgi:hypothetical protein
LHRLSVTPTHPSPADLRHNLHLWTRHPEHAHSNFHNVERVYLAEQKALAEKRKIAELMKERAENARVEELQVCVWV